MKINFKKISAIAGSVLLAGMTMGVAAAANYPAPFVSGSSADVAIVYGTGTGVSQLDQVEATNIQIDLSGELTGDVTTVSGGESFTLEKTSNKFNFNDALNAVYSNLDEEDMDFLADGTYDDGDVDDDYEQKITLGSKTLSLFADTDYEDDEPTVGFRWTNGETILSYEIDFDDGVNYTEMVDTDIPILGKEYYVIAAAAAQIDVLDSAEKNILSDGEEMVVNGKTVSIAFIDEDEVKFNVDGELTDKLVDHEYEELDDGTYIVANEVLYEAKEVGVSQVIFSLGLGKLELINGEEMEIDDDDVDGLEITLTTASSLLDKITITWKSHRETFLTEGNAISMPAFESISLVYEGLDYPSDSEVVGFDNGDTFTIEMDNYDLPVMWFDGTDALMGEEDNELIVATSIALNTTWFVPARLANLTGGLDLEESDRIIITRIDTDLSDCETLYYEVDTIDNDSGTIEVVLEDLLGDSDITFDEIEAKDKGDFTIWLEGINGSTAGRAYLNFTAASGTVTYNKVVSDKGVVITLPTDPTDAYTGATFTLAEADKDEDVNEGRAWTVTVKNTSNDKLHVSTHNLTSYDEKESDDHYIGVVPSDLASTFTFDSSADEYDYGVEYFGEEVPATVKVVVDADVSTTGAGLGNVVIMDTEVDAMDGKNLIIVGGSCINAVAANLLGDVALCGAEFTAETGVGAGQYLIKSFDNPYDSDKIAVLVAGYNVEDTQAASQYLRTQTVNTATVDMVGTTATIS